MLIFVTHAKAGSTWVHQVLVSLFGKRVYPREYTQLSLPVRRGYVSTTFLTREQFLSRPDFAETQHFVLIRDLRDTLVSRFFYLRRHHKEGDTGPVAEARAELQNVSVEEGLRRAMKQRGMVMTEEIQRSWLTSGEEVLRYEELIADDLNQFRKLFLEKLKLPVSEKRLEKAVVANRFEAVYKRKPGEESLASHGRKGVPGDWRNHFTPALAQEFDAVYGQTLLASGAETDPAWARNFTGPNASLAVD